MRVAFLAPLPPPRTGQSLCDLAVLTRLELTHTVDVVPTSKGEFRQGVGSVRHLGATARQVLRILSAAVAVRRSPADVIYLSPSQTVIGHLKDLLLLTVIGKRRRSRSVLHLHGGGFRRVLNGPWSALTKRLFGSVGAAIVLGPSLRAQLDGIVAAERIVEVANFAADDVFADDETIAAAWSQERLGVLLLGSLFDTKGYPAVLDAARQLADTDVAVRFSIAGGAPSPDDLAVVTSAAAEVDQLDYLGELDGAALAAALATHAVVVVPTRYPWEGQPLVILEAYASGAVVAATDHAGIGDIFTPGANGPELHGATPAELARSLVTALTDIASDRAAGLEIARANRRRAEHFRQERFTAEVEAVLTTVSEGQPPSTSR